MVWTRAGMAMVAGVMAMCVPFVARAQDCAGGGIMLDIGDLNGTKAWAYGVSADGGVVVGESYWGGGPQTAFRWRSTTGTMQALGTVSTVGSMGIAASADGSIVVGAEYDPTGSARRAFRWTQAGGMRLLTNMAGSQPQSEANSVSADGTIVVGAARSGTASNHACVWNMVGGGTGGSLLDLGTLPGGTADSRAYGVSANGGVVVGYSNVAGVSRAFRWTQAEGMQSLGTLGGTSSSAQGVSADGGVVVGWALTIAGERRAFRWTQAGGIQNLGTLGGTASTAYGVSADGSVVIGSSTTTTGQERAFRWTAAEGMRDLGTMGGGVRSWARGVSADGRVVVGIATNATGRERAFRWVLGCPLDLSNNAGTQECDGAVDVNDLLFFLTAFEAGTAAADLANALGAGVPDGGVTIDDLLFFLSGFEAGC